MRANLAIAAVILIVGACVVVLLSRRKDGNGNRSGRWVFLAALFAGPVIAVEFWAVDVFVLNSDMYPSAFQADAMATLSRIMVMGAFVGVFASVVFAIVSRARQRPDD